MSNLDTNTTTNQDNKWQEIIVLAGSNILTLIIIVILNFLIWYCSKNEDQGQTFRKYSVATIRSASRSNSTASTSFSHPNQEHDNKSLFNRSHHSSNDNKHHHHHQPQHRNNKSTTTSSASSAAQTKQVALIQHGKQTTGERSHSGKQTNGGASGGGAQKKHS